MAFFDPTSNVLVKKIVFSHPVEGREPVAVEIDNVVCAVTGGTVQEGAATEKITFVNTPYTCSLDTGLGFNVPVISTFLHFEAVAYNVVGDFTIRVVKLQAKFSYEA